MEKVFTPSIKLIVQMLKEKAEIWQDLPLLARTHGYSFSTRMGKEIQVFVERLEKQIKLLNFIPYNAKFGGATGNFNASYSLQQY